MLCQIDQSHKSHNAPVPYPMMHHSEQKCAHFCYTNPTMHLSHIPQYTIQNRNVHISVLNGALWDMKQVHCGICELLEQRLPGNTTHNVASLCTYLLSEYSAVPLQLGQFSPKCSYTPELTCEGEIWGVYCELNSSPLSATYMRQWTGSALVQVMACRCSAPNHYLNQCWLFVDWTLGNIFQWNLNENSIIFIQGNAIESLVCQNGSHFFQGEMS